MWLGRRGDVPFGILPGMQKKFPALCHSLLNLGPAGQAEGDHSSTKIPSLPITMPDSPVVSALNPWSGNPEFDLELGHNLYHLNNPNSHNLELLHNITLAPTKPGSTFGSALDYLSSDPGFNPGNLHRIKI